MWLVYKGSGSQWELEIRFRTHVRTLYIDILCFVRYCTKLGIRIHREGLM